MTKVRKSEAASPQADGDRGVSRESIVEALLQDILQGRLAAGERLVTDTLAKRFGVSHTPIREALLTLAGMGVLDVVANRGAVVRRFTPRDVREICQVRRILECQAVHSACGYIDVKSLERLRTTFARLSQIKRTPSGRDVANAQEADTKLHTLIRQSTRNQFLANELTRLMTMITVIRDVAWEKLVSENNLARVVEESRQHLEIVDALLSNNAKSASVAMSRHLKTGMRSIIRAVEA